jgi:redox-sensitive bicupin YhaK (pirin superfamily)
MPRDDERDHPLISERSPSYARARHEHEHPSPTTDAEEIAVLNRLVEAEDHAAAICTAAAQVLGVTLRAHAQAEVMADLAAHHESHVHALTGVIAELGAAAPRPGQRERVLGRDPADIHYLQDAAAILAAVDGTEDELGAQYAGALARPAMPASARVLLARHHEAQHAQRAHLTATMRDSARF